MAGSRTPRVSVSERPKGSGRWSVRWRENGSSREERGYASEDDALDRAHQLRKELRDPLATARSVVLVKDLLREWWDDHALKTLKPGTLDLYDRCMTTILDSRIARSRSSDLNTAAINRWSASIDRPPSYVRNMLTVLSAAYTYGVSVGTVQDNPAKGAKRPKVQRRPIRVPTMTQFIRLAMAAPEKDNERWRSLLLTAGFVGLRQQECFALRWRHIEWDDSRILVEEARSGTKGKDRIEASAPKTEAGERRVPMPAFVAEALLEHRATTAFPEEDDLVWGTSRRTMHTSSTFQQRVWNEWRDRAGVQVMWRHLRHFYASMVADSPEGNPLKLSRWMGHKKFSFTMDTYGFLFDDEETELMDSFERRIAKG